MGCGFEISQAVGCVARQPLAPTAVQIRLADELAVRERANKLVEHRCRRLQSVRRRRLRGVIFQVKFADRQARDVLQTGSRKLRQEIRERFLGIGQVAPHKLQFRDFQDCFPLLCRRRVGQVFPPGLERLRQTVHSFQRRAS